MIGKNKQREPLLWAELQQGGSHLQSLLWEFFSRCFILVGFFGLGWVFLLPIIMMHTTETPKMCCSCFSPFTALSQRWHRRFAKARRFMPQKIHMVYSIWLYKMKQYCFCCQKLFQAPEDMAKNGYEFKFRGIFFLL